MKKHAGPRRVEPRPEAQAAFVDEMSTREMRRTVWTARRLQELVPRPVRGATRRYGPGSPSTFRRRVAPFLPRRIRGARRATRCFVPQRRRQRSRLQSVGRAMMVASRPSAAGWGSRGGSPIRVDGHALDPGHPVPHLARTGTWAARGRRATLPAFRRKHNRDAVAISRRRSHRPGALAPARLQASLAPTGPLRVRHYATAAPLAPLLVFFHGGGYVFGDLETARRARAVGSCVVTAACTCLPSTTASPPSTRFQHRSSTVRQRFDGQPPTRHPSGPTRSASVSEETAREATSPPS